MPDLELKVDLRSQVPAYSQIRDQLLHKIASGELKPGNQLPTVRQLAADLRINFNTVARAYRLLDEAGVISTQHGRGTYILEPETESERQRRQAQDLERLVHHLLVEAQRLGFSPEQVEQQFNRALDAWRQMGVPPPAG